VEPALFRSRAFTGGLVVGLFFFGGLIGFSLALGLHLQLALGFTPLQAGLAQAPWALGMALGATLSGAVLGRRFGRPVIQVGSVVVAAGLVGLVLTLSGDAVTGWQLAPSLLVCGFGSGLLVAPFFDIVLAGVSLPMVGSASGVLNANQQLGGAAGVAVLGTVYFQLLDAGDAPGAVRAVLWTTVGLMLATGALAGLLPRHARPEDATG
jgi:MFS family permease